MYAANMFPATEHLIMPMPLKFKLKIDYLLLHRGRNPWTSRLHFCNGIKHKIDGLHNQKCRNFVVFRLNLRISQSVVEPAQKKKIGKHRLEIGDSRLSVPDHRIS